ncbi:MAG: trypsin-like peptidase domain-containing protein [Bacillota bacterium]
MTNRLRIRVIAFVVGFALTVTCTAWAGSRSRPESITAWYRDDLKIVIDGRVTSPEVTPFIVDPGWLMVPAEFIAKELGGTASWDDETSTLTLTSPVPATSTVDTGTAAAGDGSVPPGQTMDVPSVVAKVKDSVVLITTFDKNGQGLGQGSGVVVEKDVIATALHVVAGASKVKVVDYKGRSYNCPGVLAVDEVNDLALLSCDTSLDAVTLGNSDNVAVGEQVVALGSPRGLQGTASDGIVSSVRNIDGKSYIQITTPISPGSSGGGLFGMNAHLLGITTALITDSQNLNLAVPSATLATLMKQPRTLSAFPPAAALDEISQSFVTLNWPDGATYVGQIDEYGKPHGLGKFTWNNGDVYDGTWYHGSRSGLGTYTWANGQVYAGTWYEGLRSGLGEMTYPDGSRYSGYYLMDYMHGLGTYTWPNGDSLRGEWKMDRVDGIAMYTWADGARFIGEYRDDEENGLGVMMWPDGQIEGGTWVNGVRASAKTR